jgi:hypothetical protein
MVREGVLVTEEQAAKHDAQRDYGFTDTEFDKASTELAAEWGHKPQPGDIIWRLQNERVVELGKRRDWAGLSTVTRDMALQAYKEGHDHFKLAQDSQRYALLDLQKSFKQVELRSGFANSCCNNECGHCSPKGKVMSVAVALQEMPIPRKDCGYHLHKAIEGQIGWCVCDYSAVISSMK